MYAFVLDQNKKPLIPCRMARARILLKQGRAAVYRRYPFTIILKDRIVENSVVTENRVKIDPGSTTTGMVVVTEKTKEKKVVFAAELEHHGESIKRSLDSRRFIRGHRRHRKTRYRPARFLNRRKSSDWLAPSLESRVGNIINWVRKLIKICPVSAISQELVKFDFQKMENPDIKGIEYQQGTLQGFEVREYLLERWGRKCVYCGKGDIPLQVEHIIARTNGGTDRISNLTLACESCNLKKGSRFIEEFLSGKSDILKKIKCQLKSDVKNASAVNITRWKIKTKLSEFGLLVECGSGGRTKFNRIKQSYPKAHWIDAACVGSSGEEVKLDSSMPYLHIKAMGRGDRQVCRTNKYGFPDRLRLRKKRVEGFQTGDIVCAKSYKGKNAGTYTGRVVIRSTGSFMLFGKNFSYKNVRMVQRVDGYDYSVKNLRAS